ncbi:MerR family transcriptional regulator [Haliangium ochraceum]|uniref:Transcriptional regulator, MerR family n=1 Tax=Haliangium ochraceum (strain DSM 14365 / JCM 11303 / SMP-2) TaxID=502025 RepID=D0LTN8_HALO1|nr:MerR family transcriptional regulator [Haliangium ochraceum]ACY15732.1 transcriptional regulator, MerR family [Haliangium ochraceum DSM 14365]
MSRAASTRAAAPSEGEWPYRMKELCALTGLSRQAIHFYIQQGLVPPGHKTGRNMAYYGEEHLARLKLVRKLQHERFLPLKAIKALLDGSNDDFAPAQRAVLREVKARLPEPALRAPEGGHTVAAEDACRAHGVRLAELERMAEIGLLAVFEDAGARRLAADDVWLLELWGRFRRMGFTEELGFSVELLRGYEVAMTTLFEHEKHLMLSALDKLTPERAAALLEQGLALAHEFLARYHAAQVRNFFAAME